MNNIPFTKYCATGNDFIAIDNRQQILSASDEELWRRLCLRRVGIGADGVLLLEHSEKADFKMRYMNADGREVEMCGNGILSITSFAGYLGILKKKYRIETMKAVYESQKNGHLFSVCMDGIFDKGEVFIEEMESKGLYLKVGVPHCVLLMDEVENLDVAYMGRRIRTDSRFPEGTNVNFFQIVRPGEIKVRFYERGVEAETLSCGTGAVATAWAVFKLLKWKRGVILHTRGGELTVSFDDHFKNVFLSGDVKEIYRGFLQ